MSVMVFLCTGWLNIIYMFSLRMKQEGFPRWPSVKEKSDISTY